MMSIFFRFFSIPGLNGNFRGRNGRNAPFWIFKSAGLILAASSFNKSSPFFGEGMGMSTCCVKRIPTNNYFRKVDAYKTCRESEHIALDHFFFIILSGFSSILNPGKVAKIFQYIQPSKGHQALMYAHCR